MRRILDSRVGLRMLGLFVLAAGTPVALLAWLSQEALDDSFARSQSLVVATTAKATARQTLERLRLARQTLGGAASAPVGVHAPPPALAAVLDVAADGSRSVSGRWPEGVADALADRSAGRMAALRVMQGGATGALHVVLASARADGGVRFGLVAPAYLWDGVDELPPGQWQCALDHRRAPLFCSDPAALPLATRRLERTGQEAGSAVAVKGLFLGADFDAPDWHFVAGLDFEGSTDLQAGPVRRMLPVAAAAALLLAVLLAMVQLRRTMGPLTRLAAGAREIAQRRLGLQVAVRGGDEFGDLAQAFNDMSRRLQAQFDELGTLAELDRRIVGREPLASIRAAIADHLQRLVPDRAVAVAHVDPAGPRRFACETRVPGGGRGTLELVLTESGPLEHLLAHADDWCPLDGGLPWPGFEAARALPMRWGEHSFGFVAVAWRPDDRPDEDLLRRTRELRDRAAIAASAEAHEHTLQHAARHDAVTGLLNRNGLRDALARLIAESGPGPRTLAVLYVDLDRFKSINDTLGHAAGDQALGAVAERLRGCMPPRALAARPAGDEFVVLLPEAHGGDATTLAESICQALGHPMLLGESTFFVRGSVGIAQCADPSLSVDAVLRGADQAMFVAKRRGGGRYAQFDAQLDAQAQRRAWIEAELPRAAARGQLLLHYQPRVERRSGRLTAVEALIRWQHPERGLCPPAEFIPIAEESDLIEHVGRWVIETACSQLRVWRAKGIDDLRIAINLSARHLGSSRLLDDLGTSLRRHGVRPQDIELEITEGLLLEHTEATLQRLNALRAQGFALALDDFGTGYSSMSYLRSLPIDVLKIDRAFVKDLGRDRSSMAIARAIVALAFSLGLRTVAEGVEDTLQWQALAGLGCDEVQGYLVGRPMPAEAIEALLAAPPVWPQADTAPIALKPIGG